MPEVGHLLLVIPGNEELLVLPEQHQTNQKSEFQVQSIPEEMVYIT